ncbi:unnamed protein product [Rotaria sordida]|uniref:Uncharacterized protein n=1 Tax=Rotaria sordida TaxID=392033 RepID=A0A818KV69_9BILA|nr:unnamed protein product [Rotaria sordida]CAF0788156.1 unnamed protein product [Rotaria sordida]CAF3561327.1 unnamed protein product [Rotaria sordida]CAF3726186.1 unnamed protein product [Rotaria sordida]
MYDKLSSISKSTRYQSFAQSTTAAILNGSSNIVIIDRPSRIQRWILGMIIGSAPFLVILMCWMFVSVCINNLVRYYQNRKKQHQNDIRTNGNRNIESSKINV